MFSGDFETRDGSKNRRLHQWKISIGEVLIQLHLAGAVRWPRGWRRRFA